MPIRHLILDRDGVLLVEDEHGGYLTRAQDMRWLPGAREALALFRAAGMRVTIATNQSGVGRGLMTLAALEAVHDRLRRETAESGGRIDEILSCPHAPDEGCECRKPRPGMLLEAVRLAGVPPDASLVVGDAARDLEAARAAGIPAVLVRTGKGRRVEDTPDAAGIEVFDDLLALARHLVEPPLTEEYPMSLIDEVFDDHLRVVKEAASQLREPLRQAAGAIAEALARGGKLIACGNGGSATDAEHLVAELVGRFRLERRGLPALALASGPATVTALANDYGYERVFARQVEALARPGDVLLAISTSGNSPNVVAAAASARALGCLVIGLTGEGGGALGERTDLLVAAPSRVTARIQEVHGLCVHAIAELVDRHESRSGATPGPRP